MMSPVVSRFCDYFVICGLDDNAGLEVQSTVDIDGTRETSTCAPLDRSYKPKILAHYPDSLPWNPFDEDAVRNLSLPDGLLFRTQKHELPVRFHPFVITRENGSRCYGASLVFFERVNSSHVSQAILTLQAMHLTELSSSKSYIQKRTAQSRNILSAQATLHSGRKGRRGRGEMVDPDEATRSLPRHFKLKHSLSTQSFYDQGKDTLYVSKAVSLITPLPFVQAAQQFLTGLYKQAMGRSGEEMSVESFIYHLLYHVPLPPPSRSVQLSYWGQALTCYRPNKRNQLPLCDYLVSDLLKLLDLPSFIQLFTCVLLENQVLLYSRDLHRLMLVSELVTSVLFPFNWQHVYVPILPSTLHHFLDAPVPFIMGLHAVTESPAPEELPCEANLCFVDIDHKRVTVPEDLPPFPHSDELIAELAALLNIPHHKPQQSTPMYNTYRSRSRQRKSSFSSTESSGSSEDLNNLRRNTPAPAPFTAGLVGFAEDSNEPLDSIYLENLKLNIAFREIFCNRFVHMFSSYEHFLGGPNKNFDKATFLSDQPDQDLPFLSSFIETQMFASLVDRKISGEEDPDLAIFEERIKHLRADMGESLVRTPSYERCTSVKSAQNQLEEAFKRVDFTVPPVEEILPEVPPLADPTSFPTLNTKYLNCGPKDTRNLKLLREASTIELTTSSGGPPSSTSSVRTIKQSTPASVAQANWEFIKQLLQPGATLHATIRREYLEECKVKTKRMLVEKMGPEAVALGHGEANICGVEENTLVASLCDLLERIWAHGLHIKGKGRSPLWNYLLNYQESEACKDSSKPIDPQFLTPALAWCILRKRLDNLSMMASELNLNMSPGPVTAVNSPPSERRRNKLELPVINPLPVSIGFDMRNVQSISEIKTEIGYARAWIRLSLEKKVLEKHLRALLSDDELLRGLYKRTAFLRSEEEREQFLFHLLTLNAADYYCFTNTYINIVLPYRLMIFPSKRFNISTTSANAWISVSGTLGETGTISVPRNTLEFVFTHKNLGLLTNMHIGHDNTGVSPKWLVDHVVVRNEVTGHMVKFPCGRWLGREVDDGSTERLLVGEPFKAYENTTPRRARSPSVPSARAGADCREIQEALGNAVNAIVKYFFKTDRERGGSLTVLLCGENGLVYCLEQVFLYGFKSQRLFGRNVFLWDYFVQAAGMLGERDDLDEPEEDIVHAYAQLINKINFKANTLGKNGKFQLFICLAAREHLLPRLPPLMSTLQLTRQMYDENSFLRDSELLGGLVQVLLALDDYDIVLEQSLSKGIE